MGQRDGGGGGGDGGGPDYWPTYVDAMPFCVSCGNSLTGRFCSGCGKDSQSRAVGTAAMVTGVRVAEATDVQGPTAEAQAVSAKSAPATNVLRATAEADTVAAKSATVDGKKSSTTARSSSVSTLRTWRDGPMRNWLVPKQGPVGAVSADADPEAKQAARNERDANHYTRLSAGIRQQEEERKAISARTDLAKGFFTRQFKIRGGQGFGLGTGAGRPGKHARVLLERVQLLAAEYGQEVGDYKDFSPYDWWQQSDKVKQMYEDNHWAREIEPQGTDNGVRVHGKVEQLPESYSQDTWEEQGTTKYFQNDLIKELLRSCWYEWSPSGKFNRLKSVEEWRIACMSKFGTPGSETYYEPGSRLP